MNQADPWPDPRMHMILDTKSTTHAGNPYGGATSLGKMKAR